jgi:hypothetical protein
MNAVIRAAATVSSQATFENVTAPYSRREAMTSALTPADARARLRELAPQVREALILTRRGRVLAGPRALAPAAKDLLRANRAPAVEAVTGGGVVFAARSQRHAAVVVARRGALPGPVLFGLRRVLQGLEAARE